MKIGDGYRNVGKSIAWGMKRTRRRRHISVLHRLRPWVAACVCFVLVCALRLCVLCAIVIGAQSQPEFRFRDDLAQAHEGAAMGNVIAEG